VRWVEKRAKCERGEFEGCGYGGGGDGLGMVRRGGRRVWRRRGVL